MKVYILLFTLLFFFSCNTAKEEQLSDELKVIHRIQKKLFPGGGQIRYPRITIAIQEHGITSLAIEGEARGGLEFDELNSLIHLQEVSLPGLGLSAFPKIDSLKDLRNLSLEFNLLRKVSFPENIKIDRLNLFANQVEQIKFGKNSSIRTLILANNHLKVIDSSINHLRGLQFLHINDNHITDIDLKDLPDLEVVDCRNNPIRDTANIKSRHRGTGIKFLF